MEWPTRASFLEAIVLLSWRKALYRRTVWSSTRSECRFVLLCDANLMKEVMSGARTYIMRHNAALHARSRSGDRLRLGCTALAG